MRLLAYLTGVAVTGVAPFFHLDASAEEPLELSIQDFAVDWDRYVGKRVRISGGRVNSATQTFTYYSTQGVNILVEAPWSSREDFKFVLKSRAAYEPANANCTGPLVGVVTGKLYVEEYPIVTDAYLD